MNGFFNKIKLLIDNRYLKVAYDSGGRKKPTIVFLHGIVASPNVWKPVLQRLNKDKFRLITLEMLGFNDSPKPTKCQYTADDHVKYINRTLRKLHVKKPFKIVGHSMGAIVAAHYGARHRFQITSEYLLSPPVYINDRTLHTAKSYLQNNLYMKMYEQLMKNKVFTIKAAQNLRKLTKADGLNITHEDWDTFRLNLKNTIIKQDVYSDVKNTILPTYVFYGAFDEFLIEDNVKKLADFNHVKITKLLKNDHRLNEDYAEVVSKQINTGF